MSESTLRVFDKVVYRKDKNGEPITDIINLAEDIKSLKKCLNHVEYRQRIADMNKYYNINGELAIRKSDSEGNSCYELYNYNRFNETLKILDSDFGGIFKLMSRSELMNFTEKLEVVMISNYCLYSKNGIRLSPNSYEEYVKIVGDYDVKDYGTTTVTDTFLQIQGYNYTLLLDLLNVIFNYGFMKKALYFNGVKDGFKSAFVESILARCVGVSQFLNWEGKLHSQFKYQDFLEHQLLIHTEDPKQVDGQSWKQVLSKVHNVEKKNEGRFSMNNLKTFIISRNKLEDNLHEILNNRLIVLEFKNKIETANPETYKLMKRIWFEDEECLKREIGQILYDYVEYAETVSVDDSIANLEDLEKVSTEISLFDLADMIMVDKDSEDYAKAEYAADGVLLTLEDMVEWDYKYFVEVLDKLKAQIPSEVKGSIHKTNSKSGMTTIRNHFDGFVFGDPNSKHPYSRCKIVNNINKVLKRIGVI